MNTRKKLLIFVFLLAATALSSIDFPFTEKSERETFTVTPVIQGLNFPWGLAFLPDNGGYLVTQRTGVLLMVRDGQSVPVTGTPKVAPVGQGGLLDVALSPDFVKNRLVYLSFAEGVSGLYGTAVARGKLVVAPSGTTARLEEMQIIYRALPKTGTTIHFGSRLAFDNQGFLYISLGERGLSSQAQDTRTPYGSVLRLNPDGTIPGDNPFGPLGRSPGAGTPEIWTYGHRNAQGLAKNPETGALWLHEHGPKGGDEVNILVRGANYGWPKTSYGINYNGTTITDMVSAPGIENPVIYWVPSIAPSGMAFYQGGAFPEWKGNLFVGALAGQQLRRLELVGNKIVHQEVLLLKKMGRIRDVRTGPDGFLYLLTDDANGGLYRLAPAIR